MSTMLWYVGAGFLLGWVISTLTEWLWFRGRRSRTATVSPVRGGAAGSRDQRPVYPAADYQPYAGGSDGAPASAAGNRPDPLSDFEFVQNETAADLSAAGNRPDPLSDIRGIGDVYEQRLYEGGIFTWHELAQVDPDTLREITRALPNSDPASWIEQARRLAAENGRIGAVYTGPVPDDLTRISGIDQVFEQELMAGGIFTFAQLAQATAPELAEIIPAHRLDDAIDFAAWIGEARELQAKAA